MPLIPTERAQDAEEFEAWLRVAQPGEVCLYAVEAYGKSPLGPLQTAYRAYATGRVLLVRQRRVLDPHVFELLAIKRRVIERPFIRDLDNHRVTPRVKNERDMASYAPRILECMKDGRWHTLRSIDERCNIGLQKAREILADLRYDKQVEGRIGESRTQRGERSGPGYDWTAYEYRLVSDGEPFPLGERERPEKQTEEA